MKLLKKKLKDVRRIKPAVQFFSDVVTEIDVVLNKGKGKRKYVYLNSRQNKLNAILWLVDNCPELSKAQIRKLVGTTNKTIDDIGNKYDIQAKDPVLSNVCTQADLNLEIEKAAKVAANLVDRKKN